MKETSTASLGSKKLITRTKSKNNNDQNAECWLTWNLLILAGPIYVSEGWIGHCALA